jgi:lipopolysaccharide export system protein LptC
MRQAIRELGPRRPPPVDTARARQPAGVTGERRSEAAANGWVDRHSRRVALLKRLLPTIGVALLLSIAIWPRLAPLWDRMRLVLPAIDLREAGELRMLNPRYAGTDRLGRPFVVTAASGRQVPDRQDLMSLQEPRADIKTHGGAEIVLTAATGMYQSQSQLLDLFGKVLLVHQNGTRFHTDSARVDVARNAAQGSAPVEGHGPSGDVSAAGFQIFDKGDTIVFTGKSAMVLRSARPAVDRTPPPAGLPAPVAASAARTAVEAKPLLTAARPAPAAKRAAATRRAKATSGKRTAAKKPR